MDEQKYMDWLNAYITAVEKGEDKTMLRKKFTELDGSPLLQQLIDRADAYLADYGLQRNIERDTLKAIRDNVLVQAAVENKDEEFWKKTCSTANAINERLQEANAKRSKAYSEFCVGVVMDILEFINKPAAPKAVFAWEAANE